MSIEELLTRRRQEALEDFRDFPWDRYPEPEASKRFLAAKRRWQDAVKACENYCAPR